ILQFLSSTGNKALFPSVQPYLKSTNQDVRLAAIEAVGRLGQQDALPALIQVLGTGNTMELAAVKSSLLRIKGEQFNSTLINSMDKLPSAGKVVTIDVLAARGATEASDKIFNAVKAPDTVVHNAS